MKGRYLGSTHGFHLDEHVEEGCADLLRGVVKAVFESGEKLFQHRMAEGVVQDDGQALRRPPHTPGQVRIEPPSAADRTNNQTTTGSTLKTEHRTSGELQSVASSITSFFRKSMMMGGGRSSQHWPRILQTPRTAVERTVGWGSPRSVWAHF